MISWLRSFRHGVHPHDHKHTADLPTVRLPFGERYVLPLRQHIGAPAVPVVGAGERVRRGQLIARAGGYVSSALHSPVTGTVRTVAMRRHPHGGVEQAMEIAADPYATQRLTVIGGGDVERLSRQEFVEAVQRAGIVGLGGAAFPSHVKYALREGQRARWLVLNGCECEPYLTCDHRVMVERPQDVIRGARILARQLDVEGIRIGVEANKRSAIDALRAAAGDDGAIAVDPLAVKYPQGAEKMLIKALFGWEVPPGKLPIDLGVVVNNVATMAALSDCFDRGLPLVERVLTVAGSGVARPANLIVPIGSSVRSVLDYCGLARTTRHVVMGGPMMGQPLVDLDVPVLKGTSGLLAFTEEIGRADAHSCVRCGRCLEACPNFLNPARLARLARARRWEQLEESYVMDCMECGACSFTCPSGVPIVQLVRVGKAVLRERAAPPKPPASEQRKAAAES